MKALPLIIAFPFFLFTLFIAYGQDQKTQIAVPFKTSAVKMEFFAPLGGKLTLGYEHLLKDNISLEGKAGYIGGWNKYTLRSKKGLFIKGGARFYVDQDFHIDGMRRTHPLKGKYLKLEAIYSNFMVKDEYYISGGYQSLLTTRHIYENAFSAQIIFGRQDIFANTLVLDYYVGAGYGLSFNNLEPSSSGIFADDWYYNPGKGSHMEFGKNFPLAISAGLCIGILVK